MGKDKTPVVRPKLSQAATNRLLANNRDRAKFLKLDAQSHGAKLLAAFEETMAARYSFDQDDVWREAHAAADKAVREAQDKIAQRCKELGIPKQFAPGLNMNWYGRGENAFAQRRAELRQLAKAKIDDAVHERIRAIERRAVEARTRIVEMSLDSEAALKLLNDLPPIEEEIRALDFSKIERQLIGGRFLDDDND
jgi:hypothetical protein